MNLINIPNAIGGLSVLNECANLFQWVSSAISSLRSQWRGTQKEELQEDAVWKLQRDLERLSGTTLPAMYDLIGRAEWRIHEQNVATQLSTLKDAVYDAEDLLDEFRSYELQVEVEGNETSSVEPIITFMSESLKEVEGSSNAVAHILEKLKVSSTELEKLGLHQAVPRFDKSLRPETSSFPTEPKIFGRNEEMKKITRLLGVPTDNNAGPSGRKRTRSGVGTSSHNQVSATLDNEATITSVPVLPIVGMGGVGKTTLAQNICSHPRVKSHFDKNIIWICISDDFDIKRLTKEALEQTSGEVPTTDNLNHLQLALAKSMNKKRFLIVLDDMWDENGDNWKSFYAPFKAVAQGSMMLVTTRSQKVADIVRTMNHFPLDGLEDAAFWDFFKLCAFGSGTSNNDSELEGIAKEILPKLKGSPLAAKTLGRLLGMKRNASHWKNILMSELWQHDQENSEIMPALRLSYMYLPLRLKRCFSFCAVYPKDHQFEKADLAELWVAEGFVEPQCNIPLQDTGSWYFDELLHRSFFQKPRDKYVMHDLMHDMAQLVSKDECFIIKNQSDFVKVPQNVRHLSILVSSKVDNTNLSSLRNKTKLRTLLCYKSLRNFNTDRCFDKLLCLRVISISSVLRLPNSICSRRHLRYIKISMDCLKSLPSGFSCLYNLQFLYAKSCRLESLPSDFSNLISLQKFESKDFWYCRDGKTHINVRKLGLIKNANKLSGDLIIQNLDIITKDQAAEADLYSKECLNKLTLQWNISIGSVRHTAADVLQALHPHPNVKYLHLDSYPDKSFHQEGSRGVSCYGSSSHSSNTAAFSNLTGLTIVHCYYLLSLDGILTHCLRAIKIICVDCCWNLQSLLTTERLDSFPSLEDLHIRECSSLKWEKGMLLPSSLRRLSLQDCGDISACFPSCLENLVSLESLVLISCKQVTSIRGDLWSSKLASLKELWIQDCPDLLSIGGRNAIANIEKVHISGCAKLKEPKRIRNGGLKKPWTPTYFQRNKVERLLG